MGTERQVIQDYLDALVKRPITPPTSPTTSWPPSKAPTSAPAGRGAAGRLIRYVREGAFDARPELKTLLTGDGKAEGKETAMTSTPATSHQPARCDKGCS